MFVRWVSDEGSQQQQLDEEAQAIAEMQKVFNEEESKEHNTEEGIETPGIKVGERRPWQYVKMKVPTYKWENEKGRPQHQTQSRHSAGQPQGRATKLVVQKRRRKHEQNKTRLPSPTLGRSGKLVGSLLFSGKILSPKRCIIFW